MSEGLPAATSAANEEEEEVERRRGRVGEEALRLIVGHVAAAENSEFAEPIRPDADPDAPDSMYASSAPAQLLRAYLKEHTAAADFSEPLNAALKLAKTTSSTASRRAVRGESTELKQLTTEGEAWRPLVTAVVAKLDAAAADAALLAATHTEQAQVGLAALRACFCASTPSARRTRPRLSRCAPHCSSSSSRRSRGFAPRRPTASSRRTRVRTTSRTTP